MKVLVKKKVCGSHEQCTGPTGKHCPSLILLVKEVVGPVHSARGPLTDNIFTCFSIKKKKKKRNAAWKRKSKCILKVRLDTTYFTENLKYCSKIIFKCVNNIVGPIFNEKVAKSEFCRSRKQCMDPLVCTVPCLFCWCEQCTDKQSKKKKICRVSKKKKRQKKGGKRRRQHFHLYPNATLVCRCLRSPGARLVAHFKQLFEHFKHTYTHFHLNVYQKNPNNIT